MNKIWISIIIVSLTFGVIMGNSHKMVEELFNVPSKTLMALFKIGSMLVIYNGIFNIAIKTKCIDYLSKPLRKIIIKLFRNLDNEDINLISSSVICNLLGLGPANMTIAIKIIEKLKDKTNPEYNLTLYLLINICSLCILPLSTLTLRTTFLAEINIEFIPLIFITSLLSTILAIILCKVFYHE